MTRPIFSLVTGRDFGRSNKWAKSQVTFMQIVKAALAARKK